LLRRPASLKATGRPGHLGGKFALVPGQILALRVLANGLFVRCDDHGAELHVVGSYRVENADGLSFRNVGWWLAYVGGCGDAVEDDLTDRSAEVAHCG
jgi:hypothetical protein